MSVKKKMKRNPRGTKAVDARRPAARTQAHAALRESEARYREMFENSHDLIQSVTPDGHFEYVNPAWLSTLGYSESEVADLRLWDIIHPAGRMHCEELFRRILAGTNGHSIEAELVTKDGFVRKFDDIGCMLEHAKGKIGKANIIAYYAMDFPTQQWVRAEEAQFVKSDKFQTPRSGGILAFKDQANAQDLASQYQAQLVPFADLIK